MLLIEALDVLSVLEFLKCRVEEPLVKRLFWVVPLERMLERALFEPVDSVVTES